MIKSPQISPWSIYDKNLRLNHLVVLNPQQNEKNKKQKSLKNRNKNENLIFQSMFLSKKQLNQIQNEQNKNKNFDQDLVNYSNNQQDYKPKSLDEKKISKRRQMQLRMAHLSEYQPSLQLQLAYRQVKEQVKKSLILKVLKKKLNQQVNIFEDIVNDEIFSPKRKQSKKSITPALFPQIKFVKDQYLDKITNSYEPMSSIKIKKPINQPISDINRIINKKNIGLKRSLSTINQHLNASQRVLLAEELRYLQQISQTAQLTNLNDRNQQKQFDIFKNRFARPLLKNNGVYLKKSKINN